MTDKQMTVIVTLGLIGWGIFFIDRIIKTIIKAFKKPTIGNPEAEYWKKRCEDYELLISKMGREGTID